MPADLRTDWAAPLSGAGFQDTVPTVWIEEGVLGYLPQDEARDVVRTVGMLSAPGSRFTAGHFKADENQPHYRTLKRLAAGEEGENRSLGGLGPDAGDWLNCHGWRTEFHSWNELVETLGRPVPTGDAGNGLVFAVRE